ncbi:hypothetical protein [Aliivibrio kagoshimensis]|uniref:hypothetical protein n=1 Tax=Aliivibrio kagoshimensis TaxID=2910230 RepID=UPI003D09B713
MAKIDLRPTHSTNLYKVLNLRGKACLALSDLSKVLQLIQTNNNKLDLIMVIKLQMKGFLGLVLFLSSFFSHSAISPSNTNRHDLNVLVSFINQHQKVADTLEQIDFANYSVIFDSGCVAKFIKPENSLLSLITSSAPPSLQFDSSSCPLTYKETASHQQ